MVSGTDNASSAAADVDASGGTDGSAAPKAAETAGKPRAPARAGSRDARVKEGNVGSALRSVYQQTVNEDVPDDLMQLLGKLN